MNFLSEVCVDKRAHLIAAIVLAEIVSRKNIVSLPELDDIMVSLAKDNYLEFVAMDSKKGYYYCVNMKSKGLTFKRDEKKHKNEIYLTILKTLGLAILSFAIGFVLRMIF
ncbi:MAG: hypothetical protein RR247_03160 [Clostridia bacterium]